VDLGNGLDSPEVVYQGSKEEEAVDQQRPQPLNNEIDGRLLTDSRVKTDLVHDGDAGLLALGVELLDGGGDVADSMTATWKV
jgi:hypothetical protein